jgi:hypothetical protein
LTTAVDNRVVHPNRVRSTRAGCRVRMTGDNANRLSTAIRTERARQIETCSRRAFTCGCDAMHRCRRAATASRPP